MTHMSSKQKELPPKLLTETDVTVSRHPALVAHPVKCPMVKLQIANVGTMSVFLLRFDKANFLPVEIPYDTFFSPSILAFG